MTTQAATPGIAAAPPAAKQLVLLSDIIVFFVVYAIAAHFGPKNGLWISGLSLSATGFALWMTARKQLGNSFRISAKATELVTGGLYKRIRHPIYLFGALSSLGALIAFQNWWILGAWFLYSAPIQFIRLRNENRVLEATFGEAFLAHRRGTWI